jgi:hypothetical protein
MVVGERRASGGKAGVQEFRIQKLQEFRIQEWQVRTVAAFRPVENEFSGTKGPRSECG